MMEAVDQSNHRTEIPILKEHLLFRLVEEDKSMVLSIVLEKLNVVEQEMFVNLAKKLKLATVVDGELQKQLAVSK